MEPGEIGGPEVREYERVNDAGIKGTREGKVIR